MAPSTLVLVVEDDTLLRDLICADLASCGYLGLEATTREQAMGVIEAGPQIAIVLSAVDIVSEGDGIALGQWVRNHHPEIRLLFMSGVQSAEQKVQRLCAGAGFLIKPFRTEQLLRALQAA